MHEWHWISSAVALLGLLFFAVTGITLNHADSFESAQQQYSTVSHEIPPELVGTLTQAIREYGEGEGPPTEPLRKWIHDAFGVETAGKVANWTADQIDFSLERPGGDAWLKLDLVQGKAEYHVSDAGWMAYFNDLHKGRHTGAAWAWFIDLIAAACVIFAVTGFVILKMHAVNRSLTWPLVGLGILVPLVIAALFIH
jgi:hypothetical protein